MTEYDRLNIDLRKAGVPSHFTFGQEFRPIDTLVNTDHPSHPYQDLLISYLNRLSGNALEMLIRALSEKKNKKAAFHILEIMKDYKKHPFNVIWAAANALYIINDKGTYPDVIELARNREIGKGRENLISILPRIKSNDSFQILIDCLSDPSVKGRTIEALGKFGDPQAIPFLESTEVEKSLYEYQAKATALKKLRKR